MRLPRRTSSSDGGSGAGGCAPSPVLVGVFLAMLLLSAAWTLLVPLRAQVDETSHATYAAAVARGQVLVEGHRAAASGASGQQIRHDVVVPSSYGGVQDGAACLFWHPETPESCVSPIPSHSSGRVVVSTSAANYPPVYYLLTGWVTRLLDGPAAWYAMRVLTSLVCASLATLGVAGLWCAGGGRPSVAVLGVLTPSAVCLGGAVNPAGVEVMACVALAGMVAPVVIEQRVTALRLVGAGLLTAVVAACRPSGALWAAVIALVCACALPTTEWRSLIRRRAAWGAVAIAALGCSATAAWLRIARTEESVLGAAAPDMTLREMLVRMWDSRASYLDSIVGNVGWADNPVPGWIQVVIAVGYLAVVVLALIAGTPGQRVGMALGLLTVPVSAVAIQYVSLGTVGMMWQGRYSLPLLVALGVLSLVVVRRRHPGLARLVGDVLAAAFVFGQTALLLRVAHRYAFGIEAPFTFWDLGVRHLVALGLGAIGLVAFAVVFFTSRAQAAGGRR